MPIASTRAFVLGGSPVKEQDRLVYLLTMNRGIMRAMAPGSLKARNRFGSLFELFTEGEFHYYWKENKDIITISKGEIINSYFNVVSDPGNIFYFYLVVDVLLRFVPYDHRDNRLYRLVHAVLEGRVQGRGMDLLILYFLIWVLRIEGMMFDPGLCYNCNQRGLARAWLKSDYQGILCERCRSVEKPMLHGDELTFIRWTQGNAPSGLDAWKGKIDTAKMIRAFTRKIEFHGESSLKSAQFLAEFR